MTALEYKWGAMLLESYALAAQGDFTAAEGPLRAILESKSNAKQGARVVHRRQAECDLKALKERAEETRSKAKVDHDSD